MAVRRPGATAGDIDRTPLHTGWELTRVDASELCDPHRLAQLAPQWLPATVPGTVASALRDQGAWDWNNTQDFDASDWWYRCYFQASTVRQRAMQWLSFDGLATIADVWLNGIHILRSDSMFVAHVVDVTAYLRDDNELLIRFSSLHTALAMRRPRPRWRTQLVAHQQLRWLRTTLLGRMPGWSSTPAPVGPWRGIALESPRHIVVCAATLRSHVEGRDGLVTVRLHLSVTAGISLERAAVTVGHTDGPLHVHRDGETVVVSGSLRVPDVNLWWPHTHGAQPRYRAMVTVRVDQRDVVIDLGQIGFRTITLDTANGAFTLHVNGVPIFCRGACWSTVDVVRLTGAPDEYRDALTLARDAGMNMLRVGGTMVYEAEPFYELCDELGILVWQEFMFSNMDYPASDEQFVAVVRAEVEQLLCRSQTHPSMVLLCGNNEVEQQAAMLGLPRELWMSPLFYEVIPALCHDITPDTPYWPSSPSGGTFPFHVDRGDAHYFGYGPYLRDFDDVRTSHVQFASESLAFANVPDPATVDLIPGGGAGAGHHPAWKAAVPRDHGVGWDFEDVRDHYVEQLFSVHPARLRSVDAERYLALGRVASGEVMARTIREWRRTDSGCHGALVWLFRDLRLGAGWGLVDAAGCPKAAYYYVRRASLPIALIVSDEGLNGIRLETVNDTSACIEADLRLTLYRDGEIPVATGDTALTVPPRGSVSIHADALCDGFLDMSYAYRFGPPSYDTLVATLTDRTTGALLDETFHFPTGLPSRQEHDVGLDAHIVPVSDGRYRLDVTTRRFAQSVAIVADHFRVSDNYFHVAPGGRRTTILSPITPGRSPTGTVTPLNAHRATRIVVS